VTGAERWSLCLSVLVRQQAVRFLAELHLSCPHPRAAHQLADDARVALTQGQTKIGRLILIDFLLRLALTNSVNLDFHSNAHLYFCRTTLCVDAAFAMATWLSVCLSR